MQGLLPRKGKEVIIKNPVIRRIEIFPTGSYFIEMDKCLETSKEKEQFQKELDMFNNIYEKIFFIVLSILGARMRWKNDKLQFSW